MKRLDFKHWHSLMTLTNTGLRLVTNGVIVHDSLQIIQSKVEHLNGEGKQLIRDIKEDFISLPGSGPEKEDQLPTTNGVF